MKKTNLILVLTMILSAVGCNSETVTFDGGVSTIIESDIGINAETYELAPDTVELTIDTVSSSTDTSQTSIPYSMPGMLCRLFVNGVEINSYGCATIVELEDTKSERIPLLEVMKGLGATVEWQDESIVNIEYRGEMLVLDTFKNTLRCAEYENCLIPTPGDTEFFLDMIGDQYVVSRSMIAFLFQYVIDVRMTVDYDNLIIYINNYDWSAHR